MFSHFKISKFVFSSFLIAQTCMFSSAFAEKNVNVHRSSGPWMKTVFVDGFYGALVGAAGYGAYSLVKKDTFKGETLGAAAGIGFLVGAFIGIFDAAVTDSAFINYDSKKQIFALGIPQTQFIPGKNEFGAEVKVLTFRF